jgi:hypothetical protein
MKLNIWKLYLFAIHVRLLDNGGFRTTGLRLCRIGTTAASSIYTGSVGPFGPTRRFQGRKIEKYNDKTFKKLFI